MSIPAITPKTPYLDIFLSRVDAQPKSNLNAFFGKGIENKTTGKFLPREWYEVEIIVDTETTNNPIYPQGDFTAHTDDGLTFPCSTNGDYNKNFRSKDDLKILGRWIKGKLEKSGALKQFEPVTSETLQKYGRDYIRLYKLSDSDYYLEFDVSIQHKMLKELHLKWVGSAPQFDVEFAKRINLFTGDNGLGKTFFSLNSSRNWHNGIGRRNMTMISQHLERLCRCCGRSFHTFIQQHLIPNIGSISLRQILQPNL